MLATEFAGNYDPDSSYEAALPPRLQELVEPGRRWSMRMGRLLHGKLLDVELPEDETDETLIGYHNWLASDFKAINHEIVKDESDEGLYASSESNFHRLNSSVLNNWAFAIFPGLCGKGIPTRIQAIRFTQYKLAMQGIDYCSWRSISSEIESDYAYLRRERKEVRTAREALMTEFDAGTLLLEFARKRAGTVALPAPAQFEHGRRKAFNADWIIYDASQGRAVGVQVKTHVTNKDRETYDDSIVLLDGDYDIGNVIFHRDTPKTTRESRYTWGGMVCAQYVLATTLRQQTKDMRLLPGGLGITPQALLYNQQLTRKVIGDKRLRLTDSVKAVEDKVREKL